MFLFIHNFVAFILHCISLTFYWLIKLQHSTVVSQEHCQYCVLPKLQVSKTSKSEGVLTTLTTHKYANLLPNNAEDTPSQHNWQIAAILSFVLRSLFIHLAILEHTTKLTSTDLLVVYIPIIWNEIK